MDSIFIVLLTFVSTTDNTSFTNPSSFFSTPVGSPSKTLVYKTDEECQNGLMKIFTNLPLEEKPSVEKRDDDKIRIMAFDGDYKKKFTCHKITL